MNDQIRVGNGGNGKLELIIGPMFSGKTTELIRRIKRYIIANRKCVAIVHSIDTRYDNKKTMANSIINHDLDEFTGCEIRRTEILSDICVDDYDVVAIDEVSFFSDILTANLWANNGKIVIASGIISDYKQEPFASIHQLLPKADNIRMITAICKICSEDASYTARKKLNDEHQVIVGGKELYFPVCRKCLNKSQEEQTPN